MKMLGGYLLAIALIVGGYFGALSWLTTEPAPTVARKSPSVVVAKAIAEPVKVSEEVVTFPEAPPRPAIVADLLAEQSAQIKSATSETKPAVVPSGPSPTSAFAQFQPEPGKTRLRPAARKKTKPRYEVMIQRTVQTPDGRIVQKLIPLSRKEADAYAAYR